MPLSFPDNDCRAIITCARTAIIDRVNTHRSSPTLVLSSEVEVCGVFVTIRVDGRLRGCIGFSEMSVPFAEGLAQAAARAATEDTRFSPVTPDELERMSIEVTLLSASEEIHDASDIEVGAHGLRIELRGRRGLLLPQVAVEHGWSKEEFLAAVCEKALLEETAWQNPEARLSRFRGIVLRESAEQNMDDVHGTSRSE